jgi:hypothetical protein
MRGRELVVDGVDLSEARADACRFEQLRERTFVALCDELDTPPVVAIAHPACEASSGRLAPDELAEAYTLNPSGDDGFQPLHALPPCARASRVRHALARASVEYT